MTFDYATTASDAAALLAEFGAPVTLRQATAGTYDPTTGKVTTAAAVDVARNAVLLDFAAGQTLAAGGLIQEGDKRLLLEVGVVPALQQRVIVQGGTEYVIKGIGEVNPAGVPVLYDIHLKT